MLVHYYGNEPKLEICFVGICHGKMKDCTLVLIVCVIILSSFSSPLNISWFPFLISTHKTTIVPLIVALQSVPIPQYSYLKLCFVSLLLAKWRCMVLGNSSSGRVYALLWEALLGNYSTTEISTDIGAMQCCLPLVSFSEIKWKKKDDVGVVTLTYCWPGSTKKNLKK